MLHGGYWMDVGLCRRHLHEYISRGFHVLVAEEAGKIIGECELWIAEEGAPFGKYADIEMLVSSKDSDQPLVENALVERCVERCGRIGIENLDICPEHAGGVLDFRVLGFKELWDTRACEASLKEIEEPDFDFSIEKIGEDYSKVEHLQHWNHREPSRLRFEVCTATWPPFKLAGGDRHEKRLLAKVSVEAFGLEYVLAAWRPDWLPKVETEVDIWSAASVLRRKEQMQVVVRSAAATVERLGEGVLTVFVPKQSLAWMHEIGFRGGEKPHPWLRKDVSRPAV